MKKWLLTFAVLGLSVASAKTFTIGLTSPSTAGKVLLPAGDYRLQLKASDSEAVFTNVNTGKTYEANVKVANADKKFEYSAVETTQAGNVAHIQEIQLQGTKMKLEFN